MHVLPLTNTGLHAQVLLALVGYAIVSFLFNLLDEVRPIFASAPIEDGGLDMSTEALAWPLSFGGLSFILYVCLGASQSICPTAWDSATPFLCYILHAGVIVID